MATKIKKETSEKKVTKSSKKPVVGKTRVKATKKTTKAETKEISKKDIMDDEERDYFLKWKGPDFVKTPEETNLYRVGLFLGVLSFFWFLFGGEILPAFTFLMLIIVVFFELKSEVKEIEYEVNPIGVVLNEDVLHFSDIRSFDIGQKGGVYFVRIQMKRAVFPTRDIYLDQSFDIDYVEKLFAYFLPHEEQDSKLFNLNPKKELTEDEFIDQAVNDYLNDKY